MLLRAISGLDQGALHREAARLRGGWSSSKQLEARRGSGHFAKVCYFGLAAQWGLGLFTKVGSS